MKNLLVLLLGAIIGAAAVYFYCCKQDLSDDVVEPKGIITPAQVMALDEAFNSRHQLISDSIVKRPDNRSSWYSLSDMRSYLNYAESQAKDLGYTMDGIRVYLGAYPDTANEVGYTTMFFTPTGSKAMAKGEMNFLNFNLQSGGHPDIPGGNGFNMGTPGNPPSINYPQ
ncbi:MAG: hypothetical protein R2783_01370 [Gelidibacter sp.]